MWATFSEAQYYWYCTVLKANQHDVGNFFRSTILLVLHCTQSNVMWIKMEYIGISYVEITSVKAYAEWGTNEQHW
jgi:hypothetical protein